MRKLTASQVVSKLLEYGFDPNGPPAGSPDDPWRKGGLKKMKFTAKDFIGARGGGPPAAPAKEEDDEEKPHQADPSNPAINRFKWKPPA